MNLKLFAFLLSIGLLGYLGRANPIGFAQDDQTPLRYDLDMNSESLRLIQLEGRDPVWMTEIEKTQVMAQGFKFFDITETQELGSLAHLRPKVESSFPIPNASDTVRRILKTLSIQNLKDNLVIFSGFPTRYYRSETGRRSQKWLLSKISEIINQDASESLHKYIKLSEFLHPWGQNTIIARIEGSSPTDDGVIIIGAHLDSINKSPMLPAPGADDDGSGCVSILEAFRALIAADFHPVRAIEFHWYSGEEEGLLGSQAVAQDYEARSVNVLAMSQFDMTAWVKKGTREEVGIVVDEEFTDGNLNDFTKVLVALYLDIPFVEIKCGYACTDHASWAKAGYPASHTFESDVKNMNPYRHSENDRIDISDEFSFTHMLEFSKLAVAFAVELGYESSKL